MAKDSTLSESEERYRSLFEQSADGIFLADSQGRYMDANSAGCRMIGYSRDELLQLTFLDILDPAETPRLVQQLASLATGEPVVSEWRFLRKDGSTFIGEVRGKLLANGNYLGYLIDVTERKRYELLTREFHAYMQKRREEEKENIAREVHDELGTAAAAIKMMAHDLSNKIANDGDAEALQEWTMAMIGLLDGVVKSSRRIVTNIYPNMLNEVGLPATLEWYCAEFAGRTGIACSVQCGDEESWRGLIDGNSLINLFRVLEESLANVEHHSNASKVTVWLRRVGKVLVMSVCDNGTGLQESQIADHAAYGMRRMRERIELSGGTIEFVSPPEGAFCVTVALPLAATRTSPA